MMTVKSVIEMLQQHIKLNPHMENSTLNDSQGFEITGFGIGNGGMRVCSESRPTVSDESKWEYFQKIFTVAGFEIIEHWALVNQYWPASYLRLCAENPWWLVRTNYGLITIGWRKRVISIQWDFGNYKLTEDDVTKGGNYIHAWSQAKAIEYLMALRLRVRCA